jgi:lipid II:glycine glycyltransferase (peptidoglycan interpeptide bridge formation enzyme)
LLTFLQENCDREKWNRIELRAATAIPAGDSVFEQSTDFFFHKLDLRPSVDDIFKNFHRDCVQRKIQRATREELTQEEGRSEELLAKFYHLFLMTRRRHGLPPQPLTWFRNLIACLGDKVQIRVASKDGRPIAGLLTLRYKKSLVYKYGGSNAKFNQLGGMQMLLWKAIQDAKKEGLCELDMGRSESNNSGLVTFKDRWGATRTKLVYWRYPRSRFHSIRSATQGSFSKRVFACMPDSLLVATGRVLYKYMG